MSAEMTHNRQITSRAWVGSRDDLVALTQRIEAVYREEREADEGRYKQSRERHVKDGTSDELAETLARSEARLWRWERSVTVTLTTGDTASGDDVAEVLAKAGERHRIKSFRFEYPYTRPNTTLSISRLNGATVDIYDDDEYKADSRVITITRGLKERRPAWSIVFGLWGYIGVVMIAYALVWAIALSYDPSGFAAATVVSLLGSGIGLSYSYGLVFWAGAFDIVGDGQSSRAGSMIRWALGAIAAAVIGSLVGHAIG